MTISSNKFISCLKLQAEKGKKIYFRPNKGNAGDSLINAGFYELARKNQIKYSEISNEEKIDIDENSVLVLSGGGNLVKEWPATLDFLYEIAARKYNLILAPQSITIDISVLDEVFKPGDIIFAREMNTYKCIEKIKNGVAVDHDHDLAFNIHHGMRDVKINFLSVFDRRNKNLKNFKYYLQIIAAVLLCIYGICYRELRAYRTDSESKRSSSPKFFDISKVCALGTYSQQINMLSAYVFLRVIKSFRKIKTDRLHVMVGAHLMGIECDFEDNSYGKLSSVYSYSIKAEDVDN